MLAIIDGDAVCYKAAFAIEKCHYKFIDEKGKETRFVEMRLPEIKANLKLTGKKGRLIRVRQVEPIHHAYHLAKQLIAKILHRQWCEKDFDTIQSITDYVIVLGGEGKNFRYKVATIKPYKGHRSRRPKYLQEVRKYLIDRYKTLISPSYLEADDTIGILSQKRKDCIVVGVDKDLHMLPGMHYNLNEGTIWQSSDPGHLDLCCERKKLSGGGMLWFWAQCLMGDSADNIPGVPGYGAVKAHEYLSNSVLRYPNVGDSVRALYHSRFGSDLRLREIMTLLWIHRKENDDFVETWCSKL